MTTAEIVDVDERCLSRDPYGTRCAYPNGKHDTHLGWTALGAKRTWSDSPVGPQTAAEWQAAAWYLSGDLGLAIEPGQDADGPLLMLVDEPLRRWWDEKGATILANWEYEQAEPETAPVDVEAVLRGASQDRLEDAHDAGRMVPEKDYCEIPDCGCTGQAHP